MIAVIDAVLRALSYLLVPAFLIGMAGSAIVVAITLFRDIRDFLSDSGNESSSHDALN